MPEKYEREIEELLKELEHREAPKERKRRWRRQAEHWLEARRQSFKRSLACISAAELALYGFILLLASFLLRFVLPEIARFTFLAAYIFLLGSLWLFWQRGKAYLLKRLEGGNGLPYSWRLRWEEFLRWWLEKGQNGK